MDTRRRPALGTTLAGVLLTAACSVAMTLALWVAIVTLLAPHFRGFSMIVWSGALWLSAILSAGAVASSRHAIRPVLACTIAFAMFGFVYMVCEGFGVAAGSGNPAMARFVVVNLSFLPLGAFLAAEVGRWLGCRHRTKAADKPRDTGDKLTRPK